MCSVCSSHAFVQVAQEYYNETTPEGVARYSNRCLWLLERKGREQRPELGIDNGEANDANDAAREETERESSKDEEEIGDAENHNSEECESIDVGHAETDKSHTEVNRCMILWFVS